MSKKGFTLIELLVVISIIALLLSILMPSLNKVKIVAKRLVCATGMRQIHLGAINAAMENNDMLPKGGTHFENRDIDDAQHMAFWEYYNLAAGAGLQVPSGLDYPLCNNLELARKIEQKLHKSSFRDMWRCPTLNKELYNVGRITTLIDYGVDWMNLPFTVGTNGEWYISRLGRSYLAGFGTNKWPDPPPLSHRWQSPIRASDRGDLPLITDRNFWNLQSYSYSICHTGKSGQAVSGVSDKSPLDLYPSGGTNVTYLDGSTKFKKLSDCKLYQVQAYKDNLGTYRHQRIYFGMW